MQIVATFEHSIQLEMAISKMEQMGINDIFAIPMDNRPEQPRLFDTIHRSDGISLFSTGMILAVFFSVIGASRGFALNWGPIYWGLIGAGFGFIVGFCIDLFRQTRKKKRHREIRGKKTEVVLIIECKDSDGQEVEKILWEQLAVGVGKVH
ncbi:hypothetical protein GCM10011391_34050 [Pullulanibacillus camelliae]|uniref:Uncharacterized protein n=1 Tax=Pullulanibacillus camelliae TaxID=1707096 RepID=A0A8J2YMA7_9BACL|nr:hypothetical protein [Pullulanibacillus camelliae]GGE52374.1 hypothetical protein GCM10011391_34050 [Pullulanibacillus camelliae]